MTSASFRVAIAILASVALSACSTMASRQSAAEKDIRGRLAGHIEYLASDELEGRFPGSEGGKKTVAYQIEKLKEYGFLPGYIGEYTQSVTLVKTQLTAPVITVRTDGSSQQLDSDQAALLRFSEEQAFENAPVVAIAGNMTSSDHQMDGKVLLLNSPDRGSDLFRIARESHARAIIVVVDDPRRLARAQSAAGRAGYSLAGPSNRDMPMLYISADAAQMMLGDLDTTLEAIALLAEGADGVHELPISIGLNATVEKSEIVTSNVIGVLPGTKPGSGAVMLLAHWDHTGLCRPEGAPDRICNGAADNASGIAAMLEAGRIVAEGPRPERDIYLMGNTAEELGLLGARAFAANPPIPAKEFVATFSMDTLAIAGPNAPLTIVGHGTTSLDDGIKAVGEGLGRTFDIKDEHQQFTRRHDGWALMQAGIPSVVVGSAFGDQEKMDAFFANRYHQPSDEFDEGFEMGGMLSDMPLFVELLRHFGSTDKYMPPVTEDDDGAKADDTTK